MRESSHFAMALHVLALLAYCPGQWLTSDFLAANLNTHPVIIRRLLRILQKAGFVETRKGAGFGSRLNCNPSRITLADIYQAVEKKELFVLPARKGNTTSPVGASMEEILTPVYLAARQAMHQALARTTLAEVAAKIRSCTALEERQAA